MPVTAPTRHTQTMTLGIGQRQWYEIKALAGPAAHPEVWLYGDIGVDPDEHGVWGVSAEAFAKDMADLRAQNIDLRINSRGGNCFDGIAIFAALRNHPATVTAYVDGLAASAASFIALAADRVVMERNAQMMIHDAHGLSIGDATSMRKMADLLDKMSDNIADIYAQRAGGTTETWRAAMATETWYSASEAVTAGLADEVRGQPTQTEPDMAAAFDLSRFTYAGRAAAPLPDVAQRTAAAVPPPDSSAPDDPVGAPPTPALLNPALIRAAIREAVA